MGNKKRILFVDDEEDFLSIVRSGLENAGYEVLTATNGREGLELAQEKKPDLAFVDIMMPIMDGYQFCRFLKFDELLKKIPVIFVTARQNDEDKKIGVKMGGDDYLIKPFETKVLVEKIKKFLG